ncbi:hypothetical protein LINPERHAP2_LOCUS9405, partial [Linum perenne]
MARAFHELPAALDSLKTQEHPPTNGSQFGGVLKKLGLKQVQVMHGLSITKWSPDADPRKDKPGATIRPPPEPDPRGEKKGDSNPGEGPRGQLMVKQLWAN